MPFPPTNEHFRILLLIENLSLLKQKGLNPLISFFSTEHKLLFKTEKE